MQFLVDEVNPSALAVTAYSPGFRRRQKSPSPAVKRRQGDQRLSSGPATTSLVTPGPASQPERDSEAGGVDPEPPADANA